jgi:hypothetical protein
LENTLDGAVSWIVALPLIVRDDPGRSIKVAVPVIFVPPLIVIDPLKK